MLLISRIIWFLSWTYCIQVVVFMIIVYLFSSAWVVISHYLDNLNLIWKNRHSNVSIGLPIMIFWLRSSYYDYILHHIGFLHGFGHRWIFLLSLKNWLIAISSNRSYRNRHCSTVRELSCMLFVVLRCVVIVKLTTHWFHHHSSIKIRLIFFVWVNIFYFFLPSIIRSDSISHF